MADEITQAEREAIDAAIAAGRVERVAAGVSAAPGAVWNGSQLVDVDWREVGWVATDIAEARRHRILSMMQSGMSRLQIADALGLEYGMVCKDVRIVLSPAWRAKWTTAK